MINNIVSIRSCVIVSLISFISFELSSAMSLLAWFSFPSLGFLSIVSVFYPILVSNTVSVCLVTSFVSIYEYFLYCIFITCSSSLRISLLCCPYISNHGYWIYDFVDIKPIFLTLDFNQYICT